MAKKAGSEKGGKGEKAGLPAPDMSLDEIRAKVLGELKEETKLGMLAYFLGDVMQGLTDLVNGLEALGIDVSKDEGKLLQPAVTKMLTRIQVLTALVAGKDKDGAWFEVVTAIGMNKAFGGKDGLNEDQIMTIIAKYFEVGEKKEEGAEEKTG